MRVTLEMIDELRSRVNVSYEEAKRTLEKNDGDLIKSIIELEEKKGKKVEKDGFSSFANRLLQLKLSIKNKNARTILDVPLVLVLLVFIMAFWVVVFLLILAILTSCKIKVYRDKTINVHGIKREMYETVEKIKVKSEEIIKDKDNITDDSNEEENEVIIE